MKILFVCLGNVARSQMAEAFYNTMSNTHGADSAGTEVEVPGQTLLQRKIERPNRSFVVDAMQDAGIDVSHCVSTQLTEDMILGYDKVISMVDEPYAPRWLVQAPNYVYWEVEDPKGLSLALTIKARDNIQRRVAMLLGEEVTKETS